MRKNLTLLSLLAFFGISTAMAQTTYQPCNLIAHPLFEAAPTGRTPVVLNQLGTSPQFGEIPRHTAQSAYSHLRTVYARNSVRNQREIDNLLQALGYTGIKDPAFTAAAITPAVLPAGTVGWMGAYSRGHKYAWSVTGRNFETFKISAKSGDCFVYVMKKCGNAFYDPSVRYTMGSSQPVAKDCKVQTITVTGRNSIKKSQMVNNMQTFEVVAVNGANPALALGTVQVPVRANYDLSATGSVNYSTTVEVCDNGQPATLAVTSPIMVKMDLQDSKLVLGNDGRLAITVGDDEYAAMRRIYSASTATTAAATMPTYTKSERNSTASSTRAVASGTGNCVAQTLKFSGANTVSDGVAKAVSQTVTVVGRNVTAGRVLQKGETADKYLCLGQYQVPATIGASYNVSGNALVSRSIEICDKGQNAPGIMDFNMPVNLDYSLSNPTFSIGDGGRVYVDLNDAQYKSLSKKFGRCCGVKGNENCL